MARLGNVRNWVVSVVQHRVRIISPDPCDAGQERLPAGRMRSGVMRSYQYPQPEEQLSSPCDAVGALRRLGDEHQDPLARDTFLTRLRPSNISARTVVFGFNVNRPVRETRRCPSVSSSPPSRSPGRSCCLFADRIGRDVGGERTSRSGLDHAANVAAKCGPEPLPLAVSNEMDRNSQPSIAASPCLGELTAPLNAAFSKLAAFGINFGRKVRAI